MPNSVPRRAWHRELGKPRKCVPTLWGLPVFMPSFLGWPSSLSSHLSPLPHCHLAILTCLFSVIRPWRGGRGQGHAGFCRGSRAVQSLPESVKEGCAARRFWALTKCPCGGSACAPPPRPFSPCPCHGDAVWMLGLSPHLGPAPWLHACGRLGTEREMLSAGELTDHPHCGPMVRS